MSAPRFRKLQPSGVMDWNLSLRGSERTALLLFFALVVLLIAVAVASNVGISVVEVALPLIAVLLLFYRSNDRFAPTVLFPALYLVWFWLGSLPLLPADSFGLLEDVARNRTWTYCLVGLVAYVFGTLAIRGGDFPSTALRNARGNWRELPTLLFLAALAITIFVAWATITLQEGIPILKSNIGQFRLEIPDRHHIAYQLLIGSSNLMLPLSFLYLWTAKRVRFRIAIYGFSLFIVFIFVSLGSRGHVLPAFLTIFALRHYLKKPWPTRHLLVAGLIILPLLSVTGYYRSLQEYGPAYVADLVDMGIPVKLQPLTNIYLYIRAPIVTFRSALGVIPAIVPYQHGSLTFGVLLQLLPGRHPSSDYFFKSILGHEFVGAGEPASLLGTFYADFGMVGIVLGMFATGLFVKAVYVQMFRGSLGWLLVYCFLWQKLVGGLYGGLFTYVIEILLPIAWMISVVVLTGGARPTRGSDIPAREDV